MTNKDTDAALNDYFGELLDESDYSSAVPAQDDQKQADLPVKTPVVFADKEHLQDIAPLSADPLHNQSVSDTRPLQADDKVTAREKPETNPVLHSAPQAPVATQSEPEPVAQTAKSVDALQSETGTYEQHKQRLEKMLRQVTTLDSPVTSPVDAPTGTELQPNTDSQTEEALQVATSADYQLLPPLNSEWLANGRPNWAQDRFDILLIEVNGLQLALPLRALGQIHRLAEDLTPLFGQSDWFMGLQKTATGNVKTVDTARFVMPERYQGEHNYQYVVSINGLLWGLAVDKIHQPISIDPDAIRWRTKRNARAWMAGTVKDHMCVLVDIPAMGEILQGEDKNHGESTGR